MYGHLLSTEYYSFVSNDSIYEQRSPCTEPPADLGFCCPHMPEDTFAHGAAHIVKREVCRGLYPIRRTFSIL